MKQNRWESSNLGVRTVGTTGCYSETISPPIRCVEYFQIQFCWFLSCDMVKGGHRTRPPQRLELRCVLGEERPGKP
jgi:hypothetical protein